MNKLEVFYFDNYNASSVKDILDDPRQVLSDNKLMNIIYEIAKQDIYFYNENQFNQEDILKLKHIGIIKSEYERLAINSPIFLANDFKSIESFVRKYALKIADEIIANKQKIYELADNIKNEFSTTRNLYHIICGMIFDGQFFHYLEEANLVTTSKIHPSGLDYLAIFYERDAKLKKYSCNLLCSYNRYKTDNYVFASFGDSNGNRLDFYRYFNLKRYNKSYDYYERLSNLLTQLENVNGIGKRFEDFINGDKIDITTYSILEELEYIKNEKVNVPVFRIKDNAEIIDAISVIIKDKTFAIFEDILKKIPTNLTSVKHKVSEKEIANEIFHIVFGSVNDILAINGFVENPVKTEKQGRYYKSFEIY